MSVYYEYIVKKYSIKSKSFIKIQNVDIQRKVQQLYQWSLHNLLISAKPFKVRVKQYKNHFMWLLLPRDLFKLI